VGNQNCTKLHLLRKCGFTKPQQILGFRSGIAPLRTAPFCHLPSAFSLYRFWRLMLHPVVPALRPVASDKTPKHPMFMQVVALLHLKCAPGGGKRKTRRHGDAGTRRYGDTAGCLLLADRCPSDLTSQKPDSIRAYPRSSEPFRTVPNQKHFFGGIVARRRPARIKVNQG